MRSNFRWILVRIGLLAILAFNQTAFSSLETKASLVAAEVGAKEEDDGHTSIDDLSRAYLLSDFEAFSGILREAKENEIDLLLPPRDHEGPRTRGERYMPALRLILDNMRKHKTAASSEDAPFLKEMRTYLINLRMRGIRFINDTYRSNVAGNSGYLDILKCMDGNFDEQSPVTAETGWRMPTIREYNGGFIVVEPSSKGVYCLGPCYFEDRVELRKNVYRLQLPPGQTPIGIPDGHGSPQTVFTEQGWLIPLRPSYYHLPIADAIHVPQLRSARFDFESSVLISQDGTITYRGTETVVHKTVPAPRIIQFAGSYPQFAVSEDGQVFMQGFEDKQRVWQAVETGGVQVKQLVEGGRYVHFLIGKNGEFKHYDREHNATVPSGLQVENAAFNQRIIVVVDKDSRLFVFGDGKKRIVNRQRGSGAQPVDMNFDSPITQVVVNEYDSVLVALKDGRIFGFGENRSGEVAPDVPKKPQLTPVEIRLGKKS